MSRRRIKDLARAILLCLPALPAWAMGLEVEQAYVRAAPPGIDTAAVYLTINNDRPVPAVLRAAHTRSAAGVAIHQHRHEDGMMRMRALPVLEIAPHTRFVLAPGGYHLMLKGLAHPLVPGEQIELTLQFAGEKELVVTLPVKPVGAEGETP